LREFCEAAAGLGAEIVHHEENEVLKSPWEPEKAYIELACCVGNYRLKNLVTT